MRKRLAGSVFVACTCSILLLGAEKPRVFITESQATQVAGEESTSDAKQSLVVTGGTSPQSVEVIRAFSRTCPNTVVTSNRDKADYVIRLDHEAISPTTPFVHGNKVAVFDKKQDLIYSDTTRLLGRAVKGACNAISAAR